MNHVNKEIIYIGKSLLNSTKGFLSKQHYRPQQQVSMFDIKRVVYHSYPITIKYFYKSKLFRIEYKNGFLISQDVINVFFKNVGFEDSKVFINNFTKDFVLCGNSTELNLYLVSFYKFDEFIMNFILF